MNISAHISKLFLKNDCIVLEGFGGFILQKSKGTIRDNNKFLPPSKVVSFNQYLKSNDGILLNHLMQIEGLKQEDAKSEIEQYINNIKTTLETENLVVLPSIGKFYYDKEKKLQFTPEEDKNFDTKSFGLTTVSFTPISRDQKIEKIKMTTQAPSVKLKGSKIKRKKIVTLTMKIAAVVILSAGIIYQFMDQKLVIKDFSKDNIASISFNDFVDSFKEKFSSKESQIESSAEVLEDKKITIYQKAEIEDSKTTANDTERSNLAKDNTTQKPEESAKNVTATVKKPKVVSTKRKPIFLTQDNYNEVYVIVGAFGVEKNAKKLQKKLAKDQITSEIIPTANGMFRVGIYGFSSYEDATDIWLLVKKSIAPSAWVLAHDEV